MAKIKPKRTKKRGAGIAPCFTQATASRLLSRLDSRPVGIGDRLKSAIFVPLGVHIAALKAGEWRENAQANEVMALANMMLLAGLEKPSVSVYEDAEALGTVVYNINTRFKDTGKWVATGDELTALSVLFDNFIECCKVLNERDIITAFDIHEKWMFVANKKGHLKDGFVPKMQIDPKNWTKAFRSQLEKTGD